MQVARPITEVTNAVSWRPQGIRYRKNEVFLDVIESVNLLVRPRQANPRTPPPSFSYSSSSTRGVVRV